MRFRLGLVAATGALAATTAIGLASPALAAEQTGLCSSSHPCISKLRHTGKAKAGIAFVVRHHTIVGAIVVGKGAPLKKGHYKFGGRCKPIVYKGHKYMSCNG